MKKIQNVEKYEYGDSYEIRTYDRGIWQHDKYVESIEEAIECMNYLMEEYDYREDDIQLVRLTYFKNIMED